MGILHVERDILFGLSYKQFRAWQHYCELEPSSEVRQEYRNAAILQMLYNINRGKGQQAKKIEEFLIRFSDDVKEKKQSQTAEQQFAMLKVLAAMHAGNIGEPRVAEEARTSEEQAAVEASIEMELARARKAMHQEHV